MENASWKRKQFRDTLNWIQHTFQTYSLFLFQYVNVIAPLKYYLYIILSSQILLGYVVFLLVYEFDKGCSLILSTAPGLLIPICANNVAIESRVQYMFPFPARHVSNDWTGDKKTWTAQGRHL